VKPSPSSVREPLLPFRTYLHSETLLFTSLFDRADSLNRRKNEVTSEARPFWRKTNGPWSQSECDICLSVVMRPLNMDEIPAHHP